LDTDDRAGVPAWQWGIALVGLFAVGDPWVSINKTWGGDDPAPWIRTLWIVFYALFLPLLLANLANIGRVALRTPILTLLAIAALASTLWSILPEVSFRRAIGVLYWLAFAYVIAARFSWRLLIKLIALAYLGMAVCSYVMIVGFPDIGIHSLDHPGAWRGVWTHKNQTGGHMAIAFLASLGAAWLYPKQRRLFVFAALLALSLIVMSRSATALVSSLLVLGFFGFIALIRTGAVIAIVTMAAAAVVALVIGGVLLLAPDMLFSAIGRDMTFTGRTDIWRFVVTSIEQSLWLGYGYGAFWEDPTGPVWWVRAGVGWLAPNAHNGWLELTLGLGLIGLFAFALVFGLACGRGILAFTHKEAGLFAPGFLLLFAIQSFGEGSVVEDNNLIWTLFTIVAAKLALDRSQPQYAEGHGP
jgi:O-antigen ligase